MHELQSGDHRPVKLGALPGTPPRHIPASEYRRATLSVPPLSSPELAAKTAAAIIKRHGCTELLAEVLARRGFKATPRLDRFLDPLHSSTVPITRLKNAKRMTAYLANLAHKPEPVALVGDYDVDGMSATAVLVLTFQALKIPHRLFMPDRYKHGYGFHPDIAKTVVAEGYRHVLAVDLGSKEKKSHQIIREAGGTLGIIDHHAVDSNIPDRKIIFVNPKQPRGGVALRSMCAGALTGRICRRLQNILIQSKNADVRQRAQAIPTNEIKSFEAISSVADCMPLVGDNRILVAHGLRKLPITTLPGLRALCQRANALAETRSIDVAFAMAPRWNALGRVGTQEELGMVPAEFGVTMATTRDPVRAEELVATADRLNILRKQIEASAVEAAEEFLHAQGSIPPAIIISGIDIHPGVIGLVAARLADKYRRPCYVCTESGDGTVRFSARGTDGYSVQRALRSVKKITTKAGGHEQAGGGGFPSARLPEFVRTLCHDALHQLGENLGHVTYRADLETTLHRLQSEGGKLAREMQRLEPYGIQNRPVRFLVRNLTVVAVRVIKGRHLDVTLREADSSGRDTYMSGKVWFKPHDEHFLADPEQVVWNASPVTASPQKSRLIDIVCVPVLDKRLKHVPAAASAELEITAAAFSD